MNNKVETDTYSNENSSIDQSLQKFASSGIINLSGTFLGMILGFLVTLIIARFYGPKVFGEYSVMISFLDLFVVIGLLGIDQSIVRLIAYHKTQNQIEKVNSYIRFSFFITIFSGFLIFILLFNLSDFIGMNLLKLNSSFPIKLISIAIPFYINIYILSAIFRGFKRIKEKVFFLEVFKNLTFLFLILILILLNISYDILFILLVLSIMSTSISFILYFFYKKPDLIKLSWEFHGSQGKKLLYFSFPLFVFTIMQRLIGKLGIFILQFYHSSKMVGLYNTAFFLGGFISIISAAFLYIYTPLASELYGEQRIQDMKKFYTIITKWISILTLPFVAILIFYPETIVTFLYGEKYLDVTKSIQIIGLGSLLGMIMGPSGATITAMGKIKSLMWYSIFIVILNFFLNIILIPIFDIEGAAFAYIISIIILNLFKSMKIFFDNKIHSIKQEVFFPIILTLLFIVFFNFLLNLFRILVLIWMIPIIYLIFIFLFGLSLLTTNNIKEEDLVIISIIEKSLGLNLDFLRRITKKLLKS